MAEKFEIKSFFEDTDSNKKKQKKSHGEKASKERKPAKEKVSFAKHSTGGFVVAIKEKAKAAWTKMRNVTIPVPEPLKKAAVWFASVRRGAETHKHLLLVMFSIFVMILVGAVGIMNHYMAYEYSYNGKVLGVVKNKEDVLKITGLVEDALTAERDLNVVIDKQKDIKFKRVAAIGKYSQVDTSEEVLKRMTYVGDVNVKAYTITIDGKRTAIVDSEEAAEKVLSAVKQTYTEKDENAVVEDAQFVEDIEIQPVNADLQRLQGEDTAKELLTAGNVVEKTHVVKPKETLADLAKEYNMTESEIKELNPDVNPKKLEVGSTLTLKSAEPMVTLKAVEFVTYTEDIDYKTVKKKSDEIYKGDTEVKVKGEKGQKLITCKVQTVNGQETSRTELVEKVEKQPVTEVVLVGTKKRPPTIGDGKFIYPVENFRLSSKFAWRWGRHHDGIDLACPTGSKVVAGDGGTVTFAGYKGSLGYVVMIDHKNGLESWYGHNSSLTVKAGDKVYAGKQIAWSGNTGRSTGPHVHFQINKNGTPVNPLDYME